MKDLENIKRMKELFECGKIKQEEMDINMQLAIAELYKSEIESLREDISKSKKERAIYLDMINNVDSAQDILDSFDEKR